MTAREVNFDGLPGLTHHYAGLSFGNEASTRHRYRVSNPQLAAKQGLKKMKALADAGYPQAVIPPQERPNVPLLRQLGFSGNDEQVVARVAQQEPDLLSAVSSASAMWVANAATVCPSADSLDGLVHLTVANLQDKFTAPAKHRLQRRCCRRFSPTALDLLSTRRCPPRPGLATKGRRTIIVSAASMALPASSSLSMAAAGGARRRRVAIRRGKPLRPARR